MEKNFLCYHFSFLHYHWHHIVQPQDDLLPVFFVAKLAGIHRYSYFALSFHDLLFLEVAEVN